MGANAVTRMAEGLAPRLEELSGGRARLRILSNLAVYKMFRAEAVWSREVLEQSAKGCDMDVDEVVEAILDAWALADADPFRAATHNKGIMNGIDAVAVATGNDFRAVEAGAHAYASFGRKVYGALTRYEKTEEGGLRGVIEVPLSVATQGGVTQVHPVARLANKIIGAKSSSELGCVMAAVGLAQNFAALRALATEGIVKGHMKLHAKNVAVMGGAKGKIVEVVASIMALEGNISTARAKELVMEMCHVM
jgi:hydroxymethylglutaryl-CoA reductase